MSEAQMTILLSAIQVALTYNDRERVLDLTAAGMTMISGAEHERMAAWREIEKLAGLTGGSSADVP